MLSVGKEVVLVAFVRPQSRGGAGKRGEGKASHDSLPLPRDRRRVVLILPKCCDNVHSLPQPHSIGPWILPKNPTRNTTHGNRLEDPHESFDLGDIYPRSTSASNKNFPNLLPGVVFSPMAYLRSTFSDLSNVFVGSLVTSTVKLKQGLNKITHAPLCS